MEPFKNIFNENSISNLAKNIKKAYPEFNEGKFLKDLLPAIDQLEMKDRVRKISNTLHSYLPSFPKAAKILVAATRSDKNPSGATGFLVWPLTQFIEDFGLDHWNESMEALRELTKEMSAEFAIRPFLIQHQERTLKQLLSWSKNSNVHVRRLCSEGSRPRLPWGQRLRKFQENPSHTLPILRILKNDPELYVRKSVANHLNDIAKDHPKIVLKELKDWITNDPKNKNIKWIARHACRSLIKAANPKALKLFGVNQAKLSKVNLKVSPGKIKMWGNIEILFRAWAHREEKWLIDYIIHHKKANGSHTPKVFKWTERTVEKGWVIISKKHAFKKISTRKYYPGEHRVEIQLNGKPVAKKSFQLG